MATPTKIEITNRIPNKSKHAPCVKAMPDRKCWITDDSGKCIHLIDQTGKVLQKEDLDEQLLGSEVHIFEVNSDGGFYVQTQECFDKYIHSYSSGEEHFEDFVDLELFTAWSIQMNQDGKVVTAQQCEDEDGKCVIYDASGEEVLVIQQDDNGDPIFDYPISAIENKNGDICVADLYKPGVFIFSKEGKFKSLFSGPSCVTFRPHSLACDSNSNILILDEINKRVDVIDKDGVYVSKLMDSSDGLVHPDTISMAEDGILWISQYEADTLVVEYKGPL